MNLVFWRSESLEEARQRRLCLIRHRRFHRTAKSRVVGLGDQRTA